MILKCKKCKRRWTYKGKKRFYTSCPDCKTSVKISQIEIVVAEENELDENELDSDE